jgi:RNA polymerase sigma-54 factor
MSVKLTTNLSQRLVLTPQLRQRIEMLQMTTLELSELIQQQMLENPVLEEVQQQEETNELAANLLDHTAGAEPSNAELINSTARNWRAQRLIGKRRGRRRSSRLILTSQQMRRQSTIRRERITPKQSEDFGADEAGRDAFEEIDFGREFQEYLDPGYKTQEFEHREDGPTFEQFLTRPPSLSNISNGNCA